jgi:hypothetical protein
MQHLDKMAAQVGPQALVHCHDEFVMHQMATFLVIYGPMHHKDVSAHTNQNSSLQFCLVEHNYGAQHHDKEKQ